LFLSTYLHEFILLRNAKNAIKTNVQKSTPKKGTYLHVPHLVAICPDIRRFKKNQRPLADTGALVSPNGSPKAEGSSFSFSKTKQ
jgi:hypothetical protein